jgi:hypothetical protein
VRVLRRKCSRKKKKCQIGDERGHPETKKGSGEGDRGSTDETNGMNTDRIDIEDTATNDLGLGRDQERDTGAGGRTQDRVVGTIARSAKAMVERSQADQPDMTAIQKECSGGEAGHRKIEVATMTADDDGTVSNCSCLATSIMSF